MSHRSSLFLGTIVLGLMNLSTAGAQPAPVNVENTEKLTATVESVDASKRLVELRAEDRTTTVAVGPEVRNLSQVKVGDEVVVQYYEGLAASFKPKGSSKTIGAIEHTTGTARTPAGTRPGVGAANSITTTVVIDSVDRSENLVSFTGPAGMTRTVPVKDPQAQKFIASLNKGDEVELTYTEAVAISVEPKLAGERMPKTTK